MLDAFALAFALVTGTPADPSPSDPPAAPAPPHKPEARPVTPPPPIYRLADAAGQVWEHTDPDALRAWVDRRNAQLIRPASVPWYPARTQCPTGRCPR